MTDSLVSKAELTVDQVDARPSRYDGPWCEYSLNLPRQPSIEVRDLDRISIIKAAVSWIAVSFMGSK